MADGYIPLPTSRYSDTDEKQTYVIPTFQGYGTVLLMTRYNFWAIQYDANGVIFQKFTSLKDNFANIVSATFNQITKQLTVNFNDANVYGGIVVYQ